MAKMFCPLTPTARSFAVRPRSQRRPVRIGEVVEDVATGFVGAVIRVEKSGGRHIMVLEDRRGCGAAFHWGPVTGSTASLWIC